MPKKTLRTVDIQREHHPHQFEKYHSFPRFWIEEANYVAIMSLLKSNGREVKFDVEMTAPKGVIVAKQKDELLTMYYVFNMEGNKNEIHAFNIREGYLFTIELRNSIFKRKGMNFLLNSMPEREKRALEGFATNYYCVLMYYLSHVGNKGFICTEERYVKRKKKKKQNQWKSRKKYVFTEDWESFLANLKNKERTQHDRIQSNSVTVKGHYRKLKDGRRVWVEGYVRGRKTS